MSKHERKGDSFDKSCSTVSKKSVSTSVALMQFSSRVRLKRSVKSNRSSVSTSVVPSEKAGKVKLSDRVTKYSKYDWHSTSQARTDELMHSVVNVTTSVRKVVPTRSLDKLFRSEHDKEEVKETGGELEDVILKRRGQHDGDTSTQANESDESSRTHRSESTGSSDFTSLYGNGKVSSLAFRSKKFMFAVERNLAKKQCLKQKGYIRKAKKQGAKVQFHHLVEYRIYDSALKPYGETRGKWLAFQRLFLLLGHRYAYYRADFNDLTSSHISSTTNRALKFWKAIITNVKTSRCIRAMDGADLLPYYREQFKPVAVQSSQELLRKVESLQTGNQYELVETYLSLALVRFEKLWLGSKKSLASSLGLLQRACKVSAKDSTASLIKMCASYILLEAFKKELAASRLIVFVEKALSLSSSTLQPKQGTEDRIESTAGLDAIGKSFDILLQLLEKIWADIEVHSQASLQQKQEKMLAARMHKWVKANAKHFTSKEREMWFAVKFFRSPAHYWSLATSEFLDAAWRIYCRGTSLAIVNEQPELFQMIYKQEPRIRALVSCQQKWDRKMLLGNDSLHKTKTGFVDLPDEKPTPALTISVSKAASRLSAICNAKDKGSVSSFVFKAISCANLSAFQKLLEGRGELAWKRVHRERVISPKSSLRHELGLPFKKVSPLTFLVECLVLEALAKNPDPVVIDIYLRMFDEAFDSVTVLNTKAYFRVLCETLRATLSMLAPLAKTRNKARRKLWGLEQELVAVKQQLQHYRKTLNKEKYQSSVAVQKLLKKGKQITSKFGTLLRSQKTLRFARQEFHVVQQSFDLKETFDPLDFSWLSRISSRSYGSQHVSAIFQIMKRLAEHIQNLGKVRAEGTKKVMFVEGFVTALLVHEAILRQQWDVARYLLPGKQKHSFREQEHSGQKCFKVTCEKEVVLEEVINILLHSTYSRSSRSNQKAYDGIYFLLYQYDLPVSNRLCKKVLKSFANTLYRAQLQSYPLLRAGEEQSMRRLLGHRILRQMFPASSNNVVYSGVLNSFCCITQPKTSQKDDESMALKARELLSCSARVGALSIYRMLLEKYLKFCSNEENLIQLSQALYEGFYLFPQPDVAVYALTAFKKAKHSSQLLRAICTKLLGLCLIDIIKSKEPENNALMTSVSLLLRVGIEADEATSCDYIVHCLASGGTYDVFASARARQRDIEWGVADLTPLFVFTTVLRRLLNKRATVPRRRASARSRFEFINHYLYLHFKESKESIWAQVRAKTFLF